MTINQFKEDIIFYLSKFNDSILNNEQLDELQELMRIVSLLEDDVIVKTQDRNYYVEDISLNGILNEINEGYEIIKLSEV